VLLVLVLLNRQFLVLLDLVLCPLLYQLLGLAYRGVELLLYCLMLH